MEEESKDKKVIKISLSKTIIITLVIIAIITGITIYVIKNKKCENNCNEELFQQELNQLENKQKEMEIYEQNNKSTNSKGINLDMIDKPIIYLYPEETAEVTIKVGSEEKLTCTYPKYESSGWKVIAEPNGKLTDVKTERELYCLYWEGKNTTKSNMKEGFVVKGEDTATFLEEKLDILGLNEREAEEFIIYWLPQMEKNAYNYIRFETIEEIDENMALEVSPKPDTVIRINMEWKALNKPIEIEEQKLENAPERNGFTLVEWGGTILK